MCTVTENATVIEIKNASYAVEAIDAGFAGVAAVRLTKLVNGETYDVVLTGDGRAECDCPSYEFTYRGTAGACKHGAACLAKGLLVAPIAGGSPVAEVAPPAVVRPVTEADLKRAAYFHLNIPKPAPVAVARKVVAIVPQPSAPALEAAPEIEPTANPRGSWPAWVDADRWTTEAPGLAGDDESTGLDLTAFASTHATVGDEVPSPVYTMPDLGGVVVVQPELVGLPPALPPMAWVEVGPRAYQMANVSPVATDYRERNAALERRARRGSFVPTPEEQAEAALLLADPRSSCLAGESSPPIGGRSFPRKPRPAFRTTTNNLTDADIWPGGYC